VLTQTRVDSVSSFTVDGVLTVDGVRFADRGELAAAGAAQGNAAAISARFTRVTGADDAKGVILPTPTAGDEYLVFSAQATNGLKIYPNVGGTINEGSANAAVTIEGKTLARFVAWNATTWDGQYTANA
jgi:hypothetical protein